ncbi:MAG: helix-turn-helix transcriptional regulator, partial [Clostridiales Family XIII bacterium]|nr:helix-turn-helix transcriptional regulator [Clostridiales Family XIII bacterium]
PDIGLNDAAKVANVSTTHFSALFSQQMGKTFVEYLTEIRMERAKEMLRYTDMKSGDIAEKVGYNDPHYFSFLFKKINGCSPRTYRAAASPEDGVSPAPCIAKSACPDERSESNETLYG